MKSVEFGVGLYGTENARESVAVARLAEELGYHRFWVGDSHMIWREVYVLLGAIATATKKIQIGPGVTHPQLRHLTVTASAMVTLDELSQGRAFLGFGVGATGPGNVGLRPVPLNQLKDSVLQLKRLMAGEEMELDRKAVRCVFAKGHSIPIYLGTRSPWVMRMAADLADGIVYTGDIDSVATLSKTVRQYAIDKGRKSDEVKIIFRIPCSISENAPEAREFVKGKIARTAFTYLGRLHRRGELHDRQDQIAVERLWKEYDTYHHMGPEHSHLVRDEWVDRFSIAGTADQVRDKVRSLVDTGVDEITIIPFEKSKESQIERFAREVMARIKF